MTERIAWGLIVRTIALLIGLGVAGWALLHVGEVLLLVALATVLATGLARIARSVQRYPLPPNGWRVPPVVTVLLIYAVLIAGLVVGTYQLVRPTVAQLGSLIDRIPGYLETLDRQLEQVTGQPGLLSGGVEPSGTGGPSIRDQISSGAVRVVGIASSAFGTLTSALFTLVLALYMVADSRRVREGLLAYLPEDQQARWRAILLECGDRIAQWLLGQIVLSIVIFAVTAVGLMFLDVPYALGLALLAGVLEVLPIIGPVLAGAMAAIVAATVDWSLAVKVIIFFVAVQQLENHLLVPRIIGEASGLHPLVVMIVILIGSGLFGVLGAFLSVPIAIAIHVTLMALGHGPDAGTIPDEAPPPAAVTEDRGPLAAGS